MTDAFESIEATLKEYTEVLQKIKSYEKVNNNAELSSKLDKYLIRINSLSENVAKEVDSALPLPRWAMHLFGGLILGEAGSKAMSSAAKKIFKKCVNTAFVTRIAAKLEGEGFKKMAGRFLFKLPKTVVKLGGAVAGTIIFEFGFAAFTASKAK